MTDHGTDQPTEGYPIELAREAAPSIERWLEYQRRHLRTPGVQAAVRVGGELVLSVALGRSDEVRDVPLRTDHLFRIASHSKTFTGTAILQLVEQGRLRLDDPLAQFVEELAGSELAGVTVRELLGHQAGVLRDGIDQDFWQLIGQFPDRAGLIEVCRTHGKVFAPNEHFKYSNLGYSLLGLVIEQVTGTTYGEHLDAAVVRPLGLRNTGAEWDPERAGEYAAGHTGLFGGSDTRETIPHVDTRAMAAATGFYSTAEDLTRYGAAHFFGAGELLTDGSKRLMQRGESVVSAHGKELGTYGLGMDVTTIGDRRLVGHSGGYPGHITRTFVDPVDQVVVSVLTNTVAGPAGALATGVVKLLNLAVQQSASGRPAWSASPVPPPKAEAQPERPDLERFCGEFASLMGVLTIALLGGRLVSFYAAAPDPTESYEELRVVNGDTLEVVPAAGFGSIGERVTYTWDDAGRPATVRYAGTRWPLEVFLARRSGQLADAVVDDRARTP